MTDKPLREALDDWPEPEGSFDEVLERAAQDRFGQPEPTLTASEVKVLTETATKVAYALGRKDAGEEIAVACEKERETYAEGIDADGGRSYALAGTSIGLTKAAEIARDLPLLASGATSDATSGVPGHQEVSEAVRSPQEPGEGS